MLPKPYRLPRIQIPLVLKSGRRLRTPLFDVIYLSSDTPKFTFITSSKLSKKATIRNRLKRLLRQAVHLQLHSLPSVSAVIIARPQLLRATLQQISDEITDLKFN